MTATVEQIEESLAAACLALGIKGLQHTEHGYVTLVQHNAARTKALVVRAGGLLHRRGLLHSLRVERSACGHAIHYIKV